MFGGNMKILLVCILPYCLAHHDLTWVRADKSDVACDAAKQSEGTGDPSSICSQNNEKLCFCVSTDKTTWVNFCGHCKVTFKSNKKKLTKLLGLDNDDLHAVHPVDGKLIRSKKPGKKAIKKWKAKKFLRNKKRRHGKGAAKKKFGLMRDGPKKSHRNQWNKRKAIKRGAKKFRGKGKKHGKRNWNKMGKKWAKRWAKHVAKKAAKKKLDRLGNIQKPKKNGLKWNKHKKGKDEKLPGSKMKSAVVVKKPGELNDEVENAKLKVEKARKRLEDQALDPVKTGPKGLKPKLEKAKPDLEQAIKPIVDKIKKAVKSSKPGHNPVNLQDPRPTDFPVPKPVDKNDRFDQLTSEKDPTLTKMHKKRQKLSLHP